MIKKVIEEYITADGTKRIHMYLHYREMRRAFDCIETTETTDRFLHRNNHSVFAVFFEKMQKTMYGIIRSGSRNN